MITLLDARVLIALGDAGHVHESAALRFFEREAVTGGWATCPTTENAFLRILSHPSYPQSLGSPVEARRLLSRLISAPGHQFWPDDLTLTDDRLHPELPGSKHLTDHFHLLLAVKHGGGSPRSTPASTRRSFPAGHRRFTPSRRPDGFSNRQQTSALKRSRIFNLLAHPL